MSTSDDSPRVPDTLRAFVNEHAVSVVPGATVLDAVRAWSADEAIAVEAGTRRLTDSRGLPIDMHAAVTGGAIFRTLPVRSAEVPGATDEEALPPVAGG